jgi:outer membrane biogenesis lipoprotein LolB
MDRRKLILSGMATAGLGACASTAQDRPGDPPRQSQYDTGRPPPIRPTR